MIVVKVGGAVAHASAQAVLELAAADAVCVVHGAGPQISADMERAGIPVEFIGGRRVTTADGIKVVRASLAAVNAGLCEAIGPRAAPLFGDEIGLKATWVPELGLVGDATGGPLPAVAAALAAGSIPVIAPLAVGPLNVNADDAAAAIAVSLDARELRFLTDVDGFMIDGEVIGWIGYEDALEQLNGGGLEGGIIPKLRAALSAAEQGIRAFIGRTEIEPVPWTGAQSLQLIDEDPE